MKEIRIPILNNEYKVIVVFGGAKEIGKVLKAYHYPENLTHYDLEQMLIDMRGKTFYHKGCYPVIALPKKPKTPEQVATLAHESVHAIKHIFESIGESSVDEAFAHSVGAVVREVLSKPSTSSIGKEKPTTVEKVTTKKNVGYDGDDIDILMEESLDS